MTNVLPDDFTGDSSLYENSRVAGNTVDGIVKRFFDEGDTTKPEGISQGAFDMLMTKLNAIKKELDAKGGRYITRNLVVYDKESKVAGEIDILAVDKDGNYMIYDVKTSKLKSWQNYTQSFAPGQLSKKEKHQLQVSGYAYLFNKMLGLSVKKLGIMPFEINYDADGNITSLFNRDGIPVSYAPRVEGMIKGTGPQGPAPAAPTAPTAPTAPATPVTPTVPGPAAPTPTVASTDGLVAPKTNSAFFGSKKNVVTSQPTVGGVKVVSMGGGAVDISALPDDMLAAMGQTQSLEDMITNLDTSGQDLEDTCSPF